MQFRFSVLLGCLLATTLVCAKNGPTLTSYLGDNANGILSCEYAPPTDLHIIQQGPKSVTLEFVPYSDLVPTRIKVYRTSDDSVIVNKVIPAGMTKAFIDDLPSDVELYLTGCSTCGNGDDGPSSPPVEIHVLILDLIVAGFTPGSEPSCPILGTSGSCSFYGEGITTPFKISTLTEYGYESRQFAVQHVANDKKLHTIMGLNGNENQKLKLFCDGGISPCNTTQKIYVKYTNSAGKNSTIAEFELLLSANVGQLNCQSLAKNSFIERMAPGPVGRPASQKGQERNDSSISLGAWASASPNPFSEYLDVYMGDKIANQIQLQLYNLSGQKVLDQQFPAGQDQYTLSTEKLQPGFYLLRIEADGEVQTLKVIKSE